VAAPAVPSDNHNKYYVEKKLYFNPFTEKYTKIEGVFFQKKKLL
jgi:hypothetical protein